MAVAAVVVILAVVFADQNTLLYSGSIASVMPVAGSSMTAPA